MKRIKGKILSSILSAAMLGAVMITPIQAKAEEDAAVVFEIAYNATESAKKGKTQELINKARETIEKLKEVLKDNENLRDKLVGNLSSQLDHLQQQQFVRFYSLLYEKDNKTEKKKIYQDDINKAREYILAFNGAKENNKYIATWSTKVDDFQQHNINEVLEELVNLEKKAGIKDTSELEHGRELIKDLLKITNNDGLKKIFKDYEKRLKKLEDKLNNKPEEKPTEKPTDEQQALFESFMKTVDKAKKLTLAEKLYPKYQNLVDECNEKLASLGIKTNAAIHKYHYFDCNESEELGFMVEFQKCKNIDDVAGAVKKIDDMYDKLKNQEIESYNKKIKEVKSFSAESLNEVIGKICGKSDDNVKITVCHVTHESFDNHGMPSGTACVLMNNHYFHKMEGKDIRAQLLVEKNGIEDYTNVFDLKVTNSEIPKIDLKEIAQKISENIPDDLQYVNPKNLKDIIQDRIKGLDIDTGWVTLEVTWKHSDNTCTNIIRDEGIGFDLYSKNIVPGNKEKNFTCFITVWNGDERCDAAESKSFVVKVTPKDDVDQGDELSLFESFMQDVQEAKSLKLKDKYYPKYDEILEACKIKLEDMGFNIEKTGLNTPGKYDYFDCNANDEHGFMYEFQNCKDVNDVQKAIKKIKDLYDKLQEEIKTIYNAKIHSIKSVTGKNTHEVIKAICGEYLDDVNITVCHVMEEYYDDNGGFAGTTSSFIDDNSFEKMKGQNIRAQFLIQRNGIRIFTHVFDLKIK